MTAPRQTPHLRPVAHFTARDTWLNDPNGLVHVGGTYHLFFQNNPEGSTWGNMSWGHATSTDLVTWTEHEVALRHTEQEQIFSGSVVVDHDNTAGFAGPGETALVAIYTSAYSASSPLHGRQVQSLAYSVDAGMTWTPHAGNPVLDRESSDFRDPKVFRWGGADGYWVMAAVEAADRQVVLYSSPDLRTWTLLSEFGPAHAVGGVWECPDLFPVRVAGTGETRWVLVVSLTPGALAGGGGTQYFVGDFDGVRFVPERLSAREELAGFDWLDHGRDYYAAVSFDNVPEDRRLMIGWANNWDYAAETPTWPWRGAMSLAREVDLVRCPDGALRVRQRPVLPTDIEGLTVFDLEVPSGPGEVSEVRITTADGADPLLLRVDGDARTLSCDRSRCGDVDFHPSFPSEDTATLRLAGATTRLRVVVDACLVEVFAEDGLVTLTQQVFPTAPLTTYDTRTVVRSGHAPGDAR
ncbi:MAG TPA: glycoside hydrolase family 32 protein [Intrasporangium sp.]|uniref:glycoside hydrolase family 32 protein n=1 Tax=Intrasporangium sp. TaxID=1925024 RepID=UPI002D796932|nr:glycoside hydrolase family 32 protein [Intrasporangium sp.]HET7398154.1 glycoside hydrolase family 32 protein [Intrasporangium sp.]